MLKNRSGFAAIEAVLLIIVLAIIGGTGWYIYHASNTAASTYNSASGDQAVVAPAKKKTTTKTTTTVEPAASETLVSMTYHAYMEGLDAHRAPAAILSSLKGNFTSSAYTTLSNSKDITAALMCSTKSTSTTFTIQDVTAMQPKRTINTVYLSINQTGMDDGAALVAVDTNNMLISGVSCPN